jgi:hypothetical protein
VTLHEDLARLPLVELAPAEFTKHFVAQKIKLTTGERSEPLRLVMGSRPDRGLRVVLIDGARALHALIPGAASTDAPETREVVIDADQASTMMLEFMAERFPAEFSAAIDQTAASILQDIVAQRADVQDAVWLTHWVRLRANAPRLDFDEACRLFGSAPALTVNSTGPMIAWDEPGELIGHDPEYERIMQIAQKVACHELEEVLVKFAGSVNAAFLAALLKRTDS